MARKTPSLLTALHDSLRVADLDKRTTAATALAKAYAAALDSAADAELRAKTLADLGPKYLQVLTALGLTSPAPRAAAGGASAPAPSAPPAAAPAAPRPPSDQPTDPGQVLELLRSSARQRRGGAAPA